MRDALILVVLSGAATLLVVCPVWPGFMSFDSIFAYGESVFGITSAALPPMQVYGFALFRSLGIGPGGVLFAQTFVLFFGAALLLRLYVSSAAALCAAFAAFIALLFVFPTTLGTLFEHWKDVPTASFCVLGIALWLAARKMRSRLLLLAAVLSLCLSVFARSNAITLVLIPLVLIVRDPLGSGGAAGRRFAIAVIVLGLAAVYAGLTWRLPDLQRLPPDRGVSFTMAWDVLGISVCEDADFLPAEIAHGASGAELRQIYDPRGWDLALTPSRGPRGLERFDANTETSAKMPSIWKQVVAAHFGCYAAHRAAVVEELLGLDRTGVWYVTNGGIEANDYGFRLAYPRAASAANAFVLSGADMLWRRAFVLYLLAPLVALIGWRLERRLFITPLLVASAFLYVMGLAVAAPASDARYTFPSNVLCILALVLDGIAIAQYMAGRRSKQPEAARGSLRVS